jgi:hypothetical protein
MRVVIKIVAGSFGSIALVLSFLSLIGGHSGAAWVYGILALVAFLVTLIR